MKRFFIIPVLLFFIGRISHSSTFDLTVGGGYHFGANYTYDYILGFHQQITIPFSMTFYPGYNKTVSIGFRNKFGYGITLYSKEKTIQDADFITDIKFDNYPYEHEVYENLSFLIKAGHNIKFVGAAGCSFKYVFVSIPNGSFEMRYNPDNPSINFRILNPGEYNYAVIGPSCDIGMEIINRSRTFAFYIGVPMDFLIPLKKIDRIRLKSKISGNYLYLIPEIDNGAYFNFSIGFDFSFSFYYLT